MLILTRRNGESFIADSVNGPIKITVLGSIEGKIRLGIAAPKDVPVWREELWDKIQAEKLAQKGKEKED